MLDELDAIREVREKKKYEALKDKLKNEEIDEIKRREDLQKFKVILQESGFDVPMSIIEKVNKEMDGNIENYIKIIKEKDDNK